MPGLALFAEEYKYWRDTYAQAQKNNDEIVSAVGARLADEMQQASRTRAEMEVIAGKAAMVVASFELPTWYDRVTKYLAWSRMWRQVGENIMNPGDGKTTALLTDWTPETTAVPSIFIEQASSERRCGLQVIPGLFRHLFQLDPPENETIWLEGSDVFIEAKSPAIPADLTRSMHEDNGTSFPIREYVTTWPHLKSDVWQTYVD